MFSLALSKSSNRMLYRMAMRMHSYNYSYMSFTSYEALYMYVLLTCRVGLHVAHFKDRAGSQATCTCISSY